VTAMERQDARYDCEGLFHMLHDSHNFHILYVYTTNNTLSLLRELAQ